jgi:hypothetical protein
MESPKLTSLVARFTVTAVAIVVLVLHLFWNRAKLDNQGVVLVVIALLPWLASIISRAELPGGWKLEFQAVKTEQQRQAQEINALKFLVANFLTEPEYRHLEGLASDKPYWARRDATTAYFEMEMRRLRALGFIQGFPERGVRSLLKAMDDARGKEINVKEHFEITARGRDYLHLRTEMLAAVSGSAEN